MDNKKLARIEEAAGVIYQNLYTVGHKYKDLETQIAVTEILNATDSLLRILKNEMNGNINI